MVIIKFSMGVPTTRGHGTSHNEFRVVVKLDADGKGSTATAERLATDATGCGTWIPVNLDEAESVVRLGLLKACEGGRGPVTVDADQFFVSASIGLIDLGKIK
jgi:hypothetical protein